MNMRLWGAVTHVNHLPILELLAELGYEGVEVCIGGQNASELKLLRVAVEDLALGLSVVTSLPKEANPISEDEVERAAALAYGRARIDEAALLGSELLVGELAQANRVFSGKAPTDLEWERSRQFLREMGEYAALADMRLALEFSNRYESYLINTAADAARMCRDVGLDNVGVLYDTSHAHIEEANPAQALPACGDHLFHVQLSESHRGTLGGGQVMWQETFATLDFLDYSGWLMVEGLGTGDSLAARSQNVWRNTFDNEQQLATDAIEFVHTALRAQAL